MSHKQFFSLIFEGDIHVAPKTKILSKESFSKMMDAEEAWKKVQEDAERYRLEVVQECETIKEQAQQAGYEEGFKKWCEIIAQQEAEIEKVRHEIEKFLVPIAIKAAKKIVGREIELSETTVVDIVSNSLKAVAQHKRIVIYANKHDLEVLEKYRPKIKQIFENLEILSLRERNDVNPGGCIIETEGGIINAQIEHLWEILERTLEVLLKPKATS